jgi:hypothetical protein
MKPTWWREKDYWIVLFPVASLDSSWHNKAMLQVPFADRIFAVGYHSGAPAIRDERAATVRRSIALSQLFLPAKG